MPSTDEWQEISGQLDRLFQPLDRIDRSSASPREKFDGAENWISSASDQIASLRLLVTTDNLPRFEQSLRTRMTVFWKLDQGLRDEVTQFNMRSTAPAAAR